MVEAKDIIHANAFPDPDIPHVWFCAKKSKTMNADGCEAGVGLYMYLFLCMSNVLLCQNVYVCMVMQPQCATFGPISNYNYASYMRIMLRFTSPLSDIHPTLGQSIDSS